MSSVPIINCADSDAAYQALSGKAGFVLAEDVGVLNLAGIFTLFPDYGNAE